MKTTLLFFTAIFIFHFSLAQGTWTAKTNIGGPAREAPSGFSIGNFGYICCGASGSTYYNDLWRYDPISNSWTQLASFPGIARDGAPAFAIGNYGYMGTGGTASSVLKDFWQYNPTTNTWLQKASFPGVARGGAAGMAIGNFGYIGVGWYPYNYYYDFWRYDPATDTWIQKASYPGNGSVECVALSIGSKGYIGMGANPCNNPFTDFWEYDPSNDSWTAKATFPGIPKQNPVHLVLCNMGYVGLGDKCGPPLYNDFYQYNPVTDVWKIRTAFPGVGRDNPFSFSIGNKGYIGTGTNGTTLADCWEFYDSTNVCGSLVGCNSPGPELIVNGDFSSGNTGFICDYIYCNTGNCLYPLRDTGYSVGTAPSFFHNSFQGADHTTGFGNMMIFNGGDSARRIWSETIPVSPSTNYYFSAWICNVVYLQDLAQIDFMINGISLGNLTVPSAMNQWIQFKGTWYSGAASSAVITLKDLNDDWDGNDFGVDDISLRTCLSMSSNFIPSDTTFCGESGGCIDFKDHSFGNPTSWKWYFPGAVPDTSTLQNPPNICYYNPGTYAVTLVVSNGTSSDSLTVSPMVRFSNSPTPPTVTTKSDTLFCSHACGYQWYYNGSAISGATDSTFVFLQYGTYAVLIQDCFGCSVISAGIITSVNELNNPGGIKISPNPSTNQFTISFSKPLSNASLKIFNIVGEEVYAQTVNGKQETVNRKLPSGIYFVEVRDQKRLWVEKIVVE